MVLSLLLAQFACGPVSYQSKNPTTDDGNSSSDATIEDTENASDQDDSSNNNTDDDQQSDNDDDNEQDEPTVYTENPEALGPYSWTVTQVSDIGADLFLTDRSEPGPIVIFSPGFQLSAVDYQSYGEKLASWGYSTALLTVDGGLFGGPSHADRSEQVSDIIDWIYEGPAVLQDAVDPELIVLMGHSLGGKVSLLTAAQDDRVISVVGIDPVDSAPPFGGDPVDFPSVAPEMMPEIDVPLLIIGELNNSQGGGFTPACAPAEENYQQYYEAAVSPSLEITFNEASHMSFVDNPGCLVCLACPSGSDDPMVTKTVTAASAIAFLEDTLNSEPWAAAWLETNLAERENSGLIELRGQNGY